MSCKLNPKQDLSVQLRTEGKQVQLSQVMPTVLSCPGVQHVQRKVYMSCRWLMLCIVLDQTHVSKAFLHALVMLSSTLRWLKCRSCAMPFWSSGCSAKWLPVTAQHACLALAASNTMNPYIQCVCLAE